MWSCLLVAPALMPRSKNTSLPGSTEGATMSVGPGSAPSVVKGTGFTPTQASKAAHTAPHTQCKTAQQRSGLTISATLNRQIAQAGTPACIDAVATRPTCGRSAMPRMSWQGFQRRRKMHVKKLASGGMCSTRPASRLLEMLGASAWNASACTPGTIRLARRSD
jgi:hypothetical protein